MIAVELREYILENGKLQWRALLEGEVIMTAPNRVEIVRKLRKKAGIGEGGVEHKDIR